jgi:hypothetical protein
LLKWKRCCLAKYLSTVLLLWRRNEDEVSED